MKIALPADNNINANVCVSFGRAPYFAVYDTESKTIAYIVNSAATSSGGAGIAAAQLLVDAGASCVITPRCGENAAAVLKAAGVELYKTEGDDLMKNIELHQNNRLSLLSEIHSGLHNHGRR